MKSDLTELIEVSRWYGSDPDWVLAGGGNTSMKDGGRIWVKASGFELATITPDGFVEMDLDALNAIWGKSYPNDEKEREAAVLEDMMAARAQGETSRPSVEALLHSLIRGRLVVHTHPALINGMTCGEDGEAATKELFGDAALWVPLTHPGYILANDIKKRLDETAEAGKPYPQMIFLQNHGLFVAGEHTSAIADLHRKASDGVGGRLGRRPCPDTGVADTGMIALAAERAWGRRLEVRTAVNGDILEFAESTDTFNPLKLPFNPDQIVYAGPGPLRVEFLTGLEEAVAWYKASWNREPRAVFVKGLGLFAVGDTARKADTALALTLDAVRIAVCAESFGGARPMSDVLIDFILDWEVEQYRAKVGTQQ